MSYIQNRVSKLLIPCKYVCVFKYQCKHVYVSHHSTFFSILFEQKKLLQYLLRFLLSYKYYIINYDPYYTSYYYSAPNGSLSIFPIFTVHHVSFVDQYTRHCCNTIIMFAPYFFAFRMYHPPDNCNPLMRARSNKRNMLRLHIIDIVGRVCKFRICGDR